MQKYSTVSTGTMWKLSGGFFAVTLVVTFIFYLNFEVLGTAAVLVAAAVYIVSGIIIGRHIEIPMLKLIFCQSGGYITVGLLLVTANLLVFNYFFNIFCVSIFPWITEICLSYLNCWILICFPALEISLLIQAIIKKAGSSKAVSEENIAEINE